MIDWIKSEESFKEYLKKYDLEDGSIKLKVRHTYGVISLSEYISKKLKLSEEDVQLAKLIALLHDIGRFEQIKTTGNFNDSKEMDHATYGVDVLFEKNLIREFIEDDKYDNIIYKAILNHNKLKIEDGLNERELLHSKIIRDADKLDNFRVKETEKLEDTFPGIYNEETINCESISQKVFDDFMNAKLIKLEDRKTQIDYWICILAFVFDLNFKESLEYVKEKNYMNILIDRIEYKNEDTKLKMEQIRKFGNKYIDEKVG